jgi:hypothetical protein
MESAACVLAVLLGALAADVVLEAARWLRWH